MSRKGLVWSGQNDEGQTKKVYHMFHGTSPDKGWAIIRNGFRLPETDCGSNDEPLMLGIGVYLSADIEKAKKHGKFVLRALVFIGNETVIDRQDHPRRKNWQNEFDSVFVPPNCGMTKNGYEETCVKSSSQIKVMGYNNFSGGGLQSKLLSPPDTGLTELLNRNGLPGSHMMDFESTLKVLLPNQFCVIL